MPLTLMRFCMLAKCRIGRKLRKRYRAPFMSFGKMLPNQLESIAATNRHVCKLHMASSLVPVPSVEPYNILAPIGTAGVSELTTWSEAGVRKVDSGAVVVSNQCCGHISSESVPKGSGMLGIRRSKFNF